MDSVFEKIWMGGATPLLPLATGCILRWSPAAPQNRLRPYSPCHDGKILDAKLPGALARSFHMGPRRRRRVLTQGSPLVIQPARKHFRASTRPRPQDG